MSLNNLKFCTGTSLAFLQLQSFKKNQKTMLAATFPRGFEATALGICSQSTNKIASMLEIVPTLPTLFLQVLQFLPQTFFFL